MKKRISEADIQNELKISRKEMKSYISNQLIKPSIDEDDNLYYLLSDVIRIRYIIMYESLGLTQKEINKKIINKSNFEIFEDLLRGVKEQAEYSLNSSLQVKLRLDRVLENLYKNGQIRVEYVDELSKFIDKKEKKKSIYDFNKELMFMLIVMIVLSIIVSLFTRTYYILIVSFIISILTLIRYIYYNKKER